MTRLRKLIVLWKLLSRDTRGVSAIEYAVIATGIAAFVVFAWTLVGSDISNMFTTVSGNVSGSASSAVDSSDSSGATETASSDNDADSDFDDS